MERTCRVAFAVEPFYLAGTAIYMPYIYQIFSGQVQLPMPSEKEQQKQFLDRIDVYKM